MLSVLDKEAAMVMDALDTMDAKAQLESMHSTVSSHWNAPVVKALAALSLSPSEFDCWRRNEGQVWSPKQRCEVCLTDRLTY